MIILRERCSQKESFLASKEPRPMSGRRAEAMYLRALQGYKIAMGADRPRTRVIARNLNPLRQECEAPPLHTQENAGGCSRDAYSERIFGSEQVRTLPHGNWYGRVSASSHLL